MSKARSNWDPSTSVSSWAPASIVAGATWAVWGVRNGFDPVSYFTLLCGAALSIWLVLVALTELTRDGRLLRALLPTAGVTLLALTQLGRWLLDSTHHRPLGAVTFAALGVFLWFGCLIVFWRRTVPLPVGALIALVAVGWVSVLLLPLGPALVEPALGLGLAALVFLLGKRVRASSRALSVGCTGSLWSAAVIAAWFGPKAAAHPFILGIPGLFS